MQHNCFEVISKIRKLSRSLDKFSKYMSTNFKITLPQLICMNELGRTGSAKMSTLIKSVNINNSAMTGIVDRLETKGYVTRYRKAGDRRSVYIEITSQGRQFLDELYQNGNFACFFNIEELTDEEAKELDSSLDRILNSIDPDIRKIELE